jgi:hypothetical protein
MVTDQGRKNALQIYQCHHFAGKYVENSRGALEQNAYKYNQN